MTSTSAIAFRKMNGLGNRCQAAPDFVSMAETFEGITPEWLNRLKVHVAGVLALNSRLGKHRWLLLLGNKTCAACQNRRKIVLLNSYPVPDRYRWWKNLTQAWPDIKFTLPLPELRWLGFLSAILFLIIIITDVVAGMMKFKGYLSPEATRFYRISEQRSLGEFIGYVILQMAVIFIVAVAMRMKSSLHLLFAVLVQYLMLDDMFMLHEAAGDAVAKRFFTSEGLSHSVALGELIFGALFGVIILGGMKKAFAASTAYLRSLCVLLAIPLCMLALCAVGVDFLHALVPHDAKYLDGIVALLEDGGELFAMFALMLVAAAQWIALSWIAPLPNRMMMSP